MNPKIILIVFAAIGLFSTNILAQSEEPAVCIPSGAYQLYIDGMGGMYGSGVYIPLDPQGNRIVGHIHILNMDPTVMGFFPTAKRREIINDEIVRTGPNTWNYSALGHGFGEAIPGVSHAPLVYIVIESGTMTASEDCNSFDMAGTAAIYLPYQDVNPKDGIPDEGEPPVICGPSQHVQRRLTVTPPSSPAFPETALPTLGDVWITDNLQTTRNLVGSVDEDLDSERALAIRWYLDDRDAKEYHIYVSVNGGKYEYLGHTIDKTENRYEWKAGARKYQNPTFNTGPQFGSSYSFLIFILTVSGDPIAWGPYKTSNSVLFQVKSEASE